MSLTLLPPTMLQAIELLPEKNIPVTLFTRHSIRDVTTKKGLAGYDLQLTLDGCQLAKAWGNFLSKMTQRHIVSCISSPIQRCLDTASLMIEGAKESAGSIVPVEVISQGLLVEPGSLVIDIEKASPFFQEKGALGFINGFISNELPGMKHASIGVCDILQLLYSRHPLYEAELALAVTHDTILAAILALITKKSYLKECDWPNMMEGVFIWFEGDSFDTCILHWIWRGERGFISVEEIRAYKKSP